MHEAGLAVAVRPSIHNVPAPGSRPLFRHRSACPGDGASLVAERPSLGALQKGHRRLARHSTLAQALLGELDGRISTSFESAAPGRFIGELDSPAGRVGQARHGAAQVAHQGTRLDAALELHIDLLERRVGRADDPGTCRQGDRRPRRADPDGQHQNADGPGGPSSQWNSACQRFKPPSWSRKRASPGKPRIEAWTAAAFWSTGWTSKALPDRCLLRFPS